MALPGALCLELSSLLLAPFLLAPAGAAPADVQATRYQPDPGAEGAAPLKGQAWRVETETYAIHLTRMDAQERWRFLRERANAATDPFAADPRGGDGFFTFLIAIENRSGGTLVFDSQSCRLVSSAQETRYPLDLPSIESAYAVLDREMPPAYRTVRGALLDGTVFLAPGQRVEGLLVFRALSGPARTFVVEVGLTTADGRRGGLRAAYRRMKR